MAEEQEEELALIGGTKVPKALKERWDELISEKNEYKGQVTELKATLLEVKTELKAVTESTSKESVAELETAKARILELEGTLAKGDTLKMLQEEGFTPDDDLMEYLDFQYGKVQPEEGKEKATFKDWFATFKAKANPVLTSYKAAEGVPAKGKAAPAKAAPAKAAKATDGKPADVKDGTFDEAAISSLSPAEWKAHKAAVRNSMFGSGAT